MTRLSDADINEMVQCNDGCALEDSVDGDEILAMAREIQERRAADLTPDDLETLAVWRRAGELSGVVYLDESDLVLLDKLLAANGAKP